MPSIFVGLMQSFPQPTQSRSFGAIMDGTCGTLQNFNSGARHTYPEGQVPFKIMTDASTITPQVTKAIRQGGILWNPAPATFS
ncbi:hypothetical protein [Niveispirillum irakense]|uniref:hypothetical protein n=1 Tax=Niveispirillum irakense TaxID=34011 RepID=UPI0013789FCB|nr:hypothetical protein [Niveispirillum irakense]